MVTLIDGGYKDVIGVSYAEETLLRAGANNHAAFSESFALIQDVD